jgi:hypothetical protein
MFYVARCGRKLRMEALNELIVRQEKSYETQTNNYVFNKAEECH